MKITCKKCGKSRNTSSFRVCTANKKTGRATTCKDCQREIDSRIREQKRSDTYVSQCRKPRLTEEERLLRKEQAKEYQKKYRKENWEDIKAQKRAYSRTLREEGIRQYGGKCSCCGEAQPEFLTLEHVHGRIDEPKKLTGSKAWARLKRLGWPKQGYTVLCFNCNCAKGIYGQCPHQTK